MKNLLTLISIIFFSCDVTEPEDCTGVAGGDASVDDCGLCTGGTTELEINYLMDECGECGGDGVEDECGVCDDIAENDCEQDCAEVWGGDAEILTYWYDEDADSLVLEILHCFVMH